MKIRLPLKHYLTASLLLILIGFAIRLHNLGSDSLWMDEIATVRVAQSGFESALEGEIDHPPLIYLLTAVTIKVWGESEFAARLPSFFAAVLTIPLLIVMGRLFGRPWIGLWAALFLVFSPFHLKYAQEARHYSLLLFTSLSSYTLLYHAMKRPRRPAWLAYGFAAALMLYTHYGGFVVLATQFLLILLWASDQLRGRKNEFLSALLPGLLLIPLLYLPLLPRFLNALSNNTGQETITGTGTTSAIANWSREAFSSFGMYYEWRPWLILFLAVVGIIFLIRQFKWRQSIYLLLSLLLPLLLIQIFVVARGAYVRYIIYLLPFYLFLAAITPVVLLQRLEKNHSSNGYLAGTLGLALIFAFTSLSPLQKEYQFIQSDWKGIAQYLSENAGENDIILGISLSQPTGFNPVYHALPYYLEKTGQSFDIMQSEDFVVDKLKALSEDQKVFAILSNWDTPTQFDESSFKVTPYSYYLFVVEDVDQNGRLLDRMITYFKRVLPIAGQPIARCMLQRDLAALEAASGRYLIANEWVNTARDSCASLPDQFLTSVRGDTKEAIFSGLLHEMKSANEMGNIEQARQLAAILLTFDAKHPAVLETLTAVNLIQKFNQGQATLTLSNAPEPIAIRQFIMPDSGDNGDVLFIHPPATAEFTLTLPDTPVAFSSRLALAPESWQWGGDGVTFVLQVETADGQTTELLHQYIENTPANQTWHPITIPLTQYAGQTITLTLSTKTGPAGDGTGDWAGWETPRLLFSVD